MFSAVKGPGRLIPRIIWFSVATDWRCCFMVTNWKIGCKEVEKNIEMREAGLWLRGWRSSCCFSARLWWLHWFLIIDYERQTGLPSFLGSINGLPCCILFMLRRFWFWSDPFLESLNLPTVMEAQSWQRKFTCTCSILCLCSSACVYSLSSILLTWW